MISLLPPPDLRAWYVERRYELLAGVAVVLLVLVIDTLRTGHARSLRATLARSRLYLLVCALFAVGVWGYELVDRREDRLRWMRPLHIAVVLVEREPLSDEAVAAFHDQAETTAKVLAAEFARHGHEGSVPFWFHPFGPVHGGVPPTPRVGDKDPLIERASQYFELRRYLSDLDAQARLRADHYDVRVYVFARAPRVGNPPLFIEGEAEEMGEIATVMVDLTPSMAEAAWIAVAHEVLHTVGATDKYDGRGHARVPEGLVEPEREPLFPQRFAELMVGEIPLTAADGKLASSWRDVRIGAATAREIRW